MFVGRFYSRRMGWDGGIEAKCFHSPLFKTSIENILEDKSGREISRLSGLNIEEDLADFAKIHPDWYFYYGEEKIITFSSLD